ncbi:MAG: replicative DNA helicase [Polyangiales bacterium]
MSGPQSGMPTPLASALQGNRGGRERFQPQVRAIDLGGRVPPHNGEAEAAVLSTVLCDGSALDSLDFLAAEHFYGDANKRIFEAALELHKRGQPVDIQTVGAWLKDRERLQAIGGISYLAQLVDATPAVAHVAAHGKIVKEKARIRRLIETCQLVAASGYGDYGEAQEFIDSAEQAIYDIARTPERSTVFQMYDVVRGAFEQLQSALERGKLITGVPSGFHDLDEKTSGMHEGELIIVAARPGMGKTSYVLNIAATVAAAPQLQAPGEEVGSDPRYGVMFFSLEMPKEQLANRMMCSEGRVNLSDLRRGQVGGEKWDRLVESANHLSQLPIWIDDSSALSVLELRAKVRRQQHEYDKVVDGKVVQKIGLVVVDYLQLMRGRENVQSREQEISEISRGLKALAKELRVPVIALSQLNRAVETRSAKDKRPQLSDLRESGAIEQDADVIQFLYRPEYYVPDKQSAEAQKMKGYAEVIIAKQRNGPTGRVPVTFIDEYTRFENRARDAWREDDE